MILVEAKYHPFVLMSVEGPGHTEAEYGAMFDAVEAAAHRALRDKTRQVCISVSSGAMSAAERRFVADRVAAMPKEVSPVNIGTIVIAQSAVFRGVLTALRWLAPSLVDIQAVASVEVAMAAAAKAFALHGIVVDARVTRDARRWLEHQLALQRKPVAARP